MAVFLRIKHLISTTGKHWYIFFLVRHLLRKIVWDSLRLRFIWLQKTRGLLLWGLLTISISYIKFRRLFYMHINCKEMHQNNFIRLQTIYLLWKLVIIHQILLNIGWVASTLVISNLLTYYNNYALNSFIIKIIHTLFVKIIIPKISILSFFFSCYQLLHMYIFSEATTYNYWKIGASQRLVLVTHYLQIILLKDCWLNSSSLFRKNNRFVYISEYTFPTFFNPKHW